MEWYIISGPSRWSHLPLDVSVQTHLIQEGWLAVRDRKEVLVVKILPLLTALIAPGFQLKPCTETLKIYSAIHTGFRACLFLFRPRENLTNYIFIAIFPIIYYLDRIA